MIAPRRSSASAINASLLWLACSLAAVVACSNQITYSRINAPDPGADGSFTVVDPELVIRDSTGPARAIKRTAR